MLTRSACSSPSAYFFPLPVAATTSSCSVSPRSSSSARHLPHRLLRQALFFTSSPSSASIRSSRRLPRLSRFLCTNIPTPPLLAYLMHPQQGVACGGDQLYSIFISRSPSLRGSRFVPAVSVRRYISRVRRNRDGKVPTGARDAATSHPNRPATAVSELHHLQ